MTKLKWGMIGGGEGSQIGPAHRLGVGIALIKAGQRGFQCPLAELLDAGGLEQGRQVVELDLHTGKASAWPEPLVSRYAASLSRVTEKRRRSGRSTVMRR